ncbi:MAG: DNA phosphorothioation system sulfurtransferase DndC [Sorangiineae bacterium PRO1]|nr:DNA phosphorothioation system sulfurtransferase DndC [Sorangiineae bacterium PRO1]
MASRDQRPDVPAFSLRRASGSFLEKTTLDAILEQVRSVYTADNRPWVVGYSGGKDSTTALQLIWYALAKLPAEQRQKPVHVISSDTLVETPVIVGYIDRTISRINDAAEETGMPFRAEKVRPKIKDTFWVNLVGRGYPAPYRRFRWCTDRLKIQPANSFIEERVNQYGEVVLVLGVRKSESTTRAQVMSLHKKPGELLSRHTSLRNAWVYTPIEDFTTDDVWNYLLNAPSPWGNANRDLVTMYRNAQAGECPLVVDTTTPSCGNSRFGCWTCTVVERDKSMEAMIESGEEWMEPLLELRDWLAETREPNRKHEFREVRRRDGRVYIWGDDKNKVIWGPYKLDVRKDVLARLLRTQHAVRSTGPDPEIKLISDAELHEIRRLWRTEEGDWEDAVPRLYREIVGEDLDWIDEDGAGSTSLDIRVLEETSAESDVPATLLRELIDLERELHGLGRRSSVYERMDKILAKDWRPGEEVLASIGWKPDVEDEDGEIGGGGNAPS